MSAPKARLPIVDSRPPRVTSDRAATRSQRAPARPLLCVLGEPGAVQSFALDVAERLCEAGSAPVALVSAPYASAFEALRARAGLGLHILEGVASSEDALASWLHELPADARVLAVGDLLPSLARPTYTVALGRSTFALAHEVDLWLPRAAPSVAAGLAETWATKHRA